VSEGPMSSGWWSELEAVLKVLPLRSRGAHRQEEESGS